MTRHDWGRVAAAPGMLWRAWPWAAIVTVIVMAIAVLNTGDTSPWGLELVIVPLLVPLIVYLDLRPRRLLKTLLGRGDLERMPRLVVALLVVHWASVAPAVAAAMMWQAGGLGAVAIGTMQASFLTYLISGFGLVVEALRLRIKHRQVKPSS